MNMDRPLSADELSELHGYVKRRAMGEPLQYISGKAAFRHITLNVRKGVLIPRPETEVLVSEVLSSLPEPERLRAFDSDISEYGELLSGCEPVGESAEEGQDGLPVAGEVAPRSSDERRSRIKIADLCTGSGCIACSLAYEHPDIDVVATDISPEAVSLARENVEALGLSDRIRIIECDLGSGIDTSSTGIFDAVVSNPPYVPSQIVDGLPAEVSGFEPHLALDGGDDGLDFFRRISAWSATVLKPGGILAVELYEESLDEAAAIAVLSGFEDIRIVPDLTGRPRILVAHAPSDMGGAAQSSAALG